MRSLTAQVCEVGKSLMSVSKVARAGQRVVVDDDGGFIEDKSSGEKIWMNERNRMYTLEMWVSNKDPAGGRFSAGQGSELQAIASSHAYKSDVGDEPT